MSRAVATNRSSDPENASTDLDAVLTDNAARLNAILGRWRSEDGSRKLPLPLARAPETATLDTAQSQPQPESQPPAAAAPVPSPQSLPQPGAETPAPVEAPSTQAIPAPEAPSTQTKPRPKPATKRPRAEVPVLETPAPAAKPNLSAPKPELKAAPLRAPSTLRIEPVAAPLSQPAIARPTGTGKQQGELWAALIASKRAIKAVGWFSCLINILMLTGPLFMLQVYDRVMTSGSISTLVALLGLTAALYGIIGVLELVRGRLVTRIGVEIDQRIGDRIFESALKKSVTNSGSPIGAQRELDALRTFVAGPAPMTFFDAWWTPIYLLVIFLTHWTLGLAATVGSALLLFTAYLSDTRSRAALLESQKAAIKSVEIAETGQRNAATITAMGMLSAYRNRWQKFNQEALAWQVYASDRLGTISAISKTLRLLMQSIMLAIGAALAVKGDISSGSIIAATIIFGRALAPVEQVIAHWRSSLKAYESYKKLAELLNDVPPLAARINLPTPKGRIDVDGLRVAAPESRQLILSNISFKVEPGTMLAVVGPSGSGKSTLARALVGLWPPFAGTIKIDGTPLQQWNTEDIGQHIGYLPQDTELFSGTVRDNIARFRTDVSDDEVFAAAAAAHAHDLIMTLPKGYDTELGSFGQHLSGGQRQRLALARALFRSPAIVVLDEPNANLDRAGDEALAAAIDDMRKRGQAIVLVSHRVQAIQIADTLLYLERGTQKAFGPRAEVLKLISGQPAPPATPATKPATAPATPSQARAPAPPSTPSAA
ncbi:MAG: type I secretion system permease/ATPase [Hyphomicrobiaceae bacterium]|nr:type I secretion system permease/ATPase [Hyphomicrobiaceae bacterium]